MSIWMNKPLNEVVALATESYNVASRLLVSCRTDIIDAWPITIISCGCPEDLRPQFHQMVLSAEADFSPGVVSRMTAFFQKAWSTPEPLMGTSSPLLNRAATKLMFF